MFPCALAALALSGCAYKGGKVVDGTNIEIGIAVPGTEWTVNFLSYTGGMTVKGNEGTRIVTSHTVAETNSYFGLVTTRRDSTLTAEIVPCAAGGDAVLSSQSLVPGPSAPSTKNQAQGTNL